MRAKRRRLSGEFKAKVALEVLAGDKTINEIAAQYEVHPSQVAVRKKQLQENAAEFLSDRRAHKATEDAELTARLLRVRISRDGKGRALDNIIVERLWRSVKYEEVYWKDYAGVDQAVRSLGVYFDFYNHRRIHQALDYRTPAAVYAQRGTGTLALIG